MITYKKIRSRWRVLYDDKVLLTPQGLAHDGGGYDELDDCLTHIRSLNIGEIENGLRKQRDDEASQATNDGAERRNDRTNVHAELREGRRKRNGDGNRARPKARKGQRNEADARVVG